VIDERSRRKDNFDEHNSVPLVLADGQAWYFPKPWLEIRPMFRGGKPTTAYRMFASTPEIDALIDLVADVATIEEEVVAVATIAALMLQHQYELDDGDLDQLLAYRVGDEASKAWFGQVMHVATGLSGPKVVRGIGT
jgi:hypothetical protein